MHFWIETICGCRSWLELLTNTTLGFG